MTRMKGYGDLEELQLQPTPPWRPVLRGLPFRRILLPREQTQLQHTEADGSSRWYRGLRPRASHGPL